MGLTNAQHVALKRHFVQKHGECYLVDAMLDLIKHREASECIGLMFPPVIGDPIEGTPARMQVHLKTAYKLIGNETKSIYSQINDFIRQLNWQVLVTAGPIPEFYDRFRETVESLHVWITGIDEIPPNVKAGLFGNYADRLKQSVSQFYEWIKSLFLAAGITIPAVLNNLFQQAISIGAAIVKFIGYTVSVFIKAAGVIVQGIYNAVFMISELVYASLTYMTYGSLTLIEAMTNQGLELQQYAAKISCFLLGCMQETMSYPSETTEETKRRRIRGFVDEWCDVITTIRSNYAIKLKTTGVMDFFSQHWFTKKILTWIDVPLSAIAWVLDNLKWLVSSVLSYGNSAQVVFSSLMRQSDLIFQVVFSRTCADVQKILMHQDATPPVSSAESGDIIDSAIKFAETINSLSQSSNAASMSEYLSTNTSVSEEDRETLKSNIQTRASVSALLRKREDTAKILNYSDDTAPTFQAEWAIAHELSKYLTKQDYDVQALLDAYETLKGTSLLLELNTLHATKEAINLQLYIVLRKVYQNTEDVARFKAVLSPETNIGIKIDETLIPQTNIIFTDEQIQSMTATQLTSRLKILVLSYESDVAEKQQEYDEAEKVQYDNLRLNSDAIRQGSISLLKGQTEGLKFITLPGALSSGYVPREQIEILTAARASLSHAEKEAGRAIREAARAKRTFMLARQEEIAKIQTRLRDIEERIKWGSQIIATAVFAGIYAYYVYNYVLSANASTHLTDFATNTTTGTGMGLVQAQQELLARLKNQTLTPENYGTAMLWITWLLSPITDWLPNAVNYVRDTLLLRTPSGVLGALDGFWDIGKQFLRGVQPLPLTFNAIVFPITYLLEGGYLLMFSVATFFFGSITLPIWDLTRDMFRISIAYTINRIWYKDPRAEYTVTGMWSESVGYFSRTLAGRSAPIAISTARFLGTAVLWSVQASAQFAITPTRLVPYVGEFVADKMNAKTIGTIDALLGAMVKGKRVVDQRFDDLFGESQANRVKTADFYKVEFTKEIPELNITEVLDGLHKEKERYAEGLEQLLTTAQESQELNLLALAPIAPTPTRLLTLEETDEDL